MARHTIRDQKICLNLARKYTTFFTSFYTMKRKFRRKYLGILEISKCSQGLIFKDFNKIKMLSSL